MAEGPGRTPSAPLYRVMTLSFTDFSVFNKSVSFNAENSLLQKPIDETSEITLSYSQAYFSLKFAALNFINPDKNRLVFKIKQIFESCGISQKTL